VFSLLTIAPNQNPIMKLLFSADKTPRGRIARYTHYLLDTVEPLVGSVGTCPCCWMDKSAVGGALGIQVLNSAVTCPYT
jgi:hypothetical protein